jgi:hypothetical protein
MSESQRIPEEVTVIFRQEESLIVPDVALPRGIRGEKETFEKAAHRLLMGIRPGIVGHVERHISTSSIEGAPRTFLMEPRTGPIEVIGSAVHKDELLEHIETHPELNRVDAAILKSVHTLLWGFPESGQTA